MKQRKIFSIKIRYSLIPALLITLFLIGCQSPNGEEPLKFESASQSAKTNKSGETAVVINYDKSENPAWAKLMYLKDGSIKTCTLEKGQKLEDLGSMLLSCAPVKTVSVGQDTVSLEFIDSPDWKNAAFRTMTKEEKELLSPICVPHQYLYHGLRESASFLPEQGLSDQQVRIYLNLFAVQLEQNPDLLSPSKDGSDSLRQYDGQEFLELSQAYYPGLPDNALEKLPAPNTEENDLGRVFLWYDPQQQEVTAGSAELGGMLPVPMVESIHEEGNSLEFTLLDYSDGEVFRKTFVCEKLEKGYAVKKVEIHKIEG